jgi:hypothetical protein
MILSFWSVTNVNEIWKRIYRVRTPIELILKPVSAILPRIFFYLKSNKILTIYNLYDKNNSTLTVNGGAK